MAMRRPYSYEHHNQKSRAQLERDFLFAFGQYGYHTGAFLGSLIEEKQATSVLIQQQIRAMMSTLYEIISHLPKENGLVEQFLIDYRENTIWFSCEFAGKLPLMLYMLFASFPGYVRTTSMPTVCATLTQLINEYNDLSFEHGGAFLRTQNEFARLVQALKEKESER